MTYEEAFKTVQTVIGNEYYAANNKYKAELAYASFSDSDRLYEEHMDEALQLRKIKDTLKEIRVLMAELEEMIRESDDEDNDCS